jgi:hypothetical protein
MATATKDVVVCVDPYTTTVEGVEEVFQQGTRLRADHPTVIAHPELWAKDGDLDEFNAKRRRLYAEVGRNRIPDTGAARILNTKFRATRSVKLDVDGEARKVKRGDLLEPNDPIAQFVPDAFELVQV